MKVRCEKIYSIDYGVTKGKIYDAVYDGLHHRIKNDNGLEVLVPPALFVIIKEEKFYEPEDGSIV